jgi:glycosyltransferase involved in cell wall biosynthesis
MKVWIINPYGNIPGENWRPHRSYTVAKTFEADGCDVTYWISNMDHRSKFERKEKEIIDDKLIIKIVPSSKYSEHISISRVKFEINFIKHFRLLAEKEETKPDLIIIGEPSLFVSFNFIKYVKKHNVKFVLDVVDIWPELFKLVLPKILQPIHKLIFLPFYLKRSWFIKKANGILSVSKAYLKIATDINDKVPSKIVYWGVDLNSFNVENRIENNKLTANIIYAGTLGDNYDVQSIINCAKRVQEQNLDVHFYIAGDGNLRQFVIDSIEQYNLTKTTYLGRISPEELVSYYQKCQLALSTYSRESTVSMPIKAFDYFAAGLPLLNSLGMDLGEMVLEHNLGLNYEPGNSNDLFDKIIYLRNNIELLKEMKLNCLEIAKQFDESKIYKDYVEFCKNIYTNEL